MRISLGLKNDFLQAEQDEKNDFHVPSTIQEHLGNLLDVESFLSIAYYNLGALSHKMLFNSALTGYPQHHPQVPYSNIDFWLMEFRPEQK